MYFDMSLRSTVQVVGTKDSVENGTLAVLGYTFIQFNGYITINERSSCGVTQGTAKYVMYGTTCNAYGSSVCV